MGVDFNNKNNEVTLVRGHYSGMIIFDANWVVCTYYLNLNLWIVFSY